MSSTDSLSLKFKQLEQLTQEFESGELELEQAIPKFKQGVSLAKELKKKLQEMENQIKEISIDLKEEAEQSTPSIDQKSQEELF